MGLKIRNYIINTPIEKILYQIKSELTNGKLKDIKFKQDSLLVTCPYHKEGKENKPACSIYCGEDNPDLEYGTVHCFACGFSGPFYHFVGECFDKDDEFGKDWLIAKYGDLMVEYLPSLPEIILNNKNTKESAQNFNLNQFQSYHPYMTQRKLKREICEKFSVKFDPVNQCIVFPVWDEHNNLTLLTTRSINSKNFFIPKFTKKPIYLLNFIMQENIKQVYVCESQINALTLWSWGYPAVALIGTGDDYQYEILNNSPIRYYILCLDGDDAGDKGINRFIKNIRKDVFIDIVKMPRGKDVNDLSEEEFKKLIEE